MPQDQASFQRHQRSPMVGNDARGVIRSTTISWDLGCVCETVFDATEGFAPCHDKRGWAGAVLPIGVEFDPYRVGIHLIAADLNLEKESLTLLSNGR